MSKLTLLSFICLASVYFLGAGGHLSSVNRRTRSREWSGADGEGFHSSTSQYNHRCSPLTDGIHPIMKGICSADLLNAVKRACSDPSYKMESNADIPSNFDDDFYVRLDREEFIDEIAQNEDEKKNALSMYDIYKVDPKVSVERSLWCDCCVHECTADHLRGHCSVLNRQISFQEFQNLFVRHRDYYDWWVPRNFDITPSSRSDENEDADGRQEAANDITSRDDYFMDSNLPNGRER
ncbi:hypothetical protein HELRODRAFT_189920 [Helobdella robusta]|uniref:Insulin-like domain-containing protein n=1 Tax=Helobdella robusta TaxID=6412 RepID=T1FRH7_HELRO|nr:hypothetical protein HELRODRAFT_189920 [Helobdella robusta]ESN90612.1 hypothetical protein HELRODRAFT_189920 [Helobdella robusta]